MNYTEYGEYLDDFNNTLQKLGHKFEVVNKHLELVSRRFAQYDALRVSALSVISSYKLEHRLEDMILSQDIEDVIWLVR